MKKIILVWLFLVFGVISFSQTLQQIEKERVKLPNGWSLTPVGKSLPLGDLPLNMAVSRTGKYVAVTNNGQSVQSIQLFDARTEKQLDALTIPKLWYGLSFSSDEKYLYASGGNDNRILQYEINNNKLHLVDSFVLGKPWPNKISPAGLVIDNNNNLLYVVTKNNSSLYVFDLLTRKLINRYPLPNEAYTCILSPQKRRLYIT